MVKLAKDVIDAAQASERKWGIPASISLAQYGVESAWGSRMPPASNNPFGIKAISGQPSVTVKTREVDKFGKDYYIQAPFRKFTSIAEAFDAHGKLLATSKYYANARSKLPDVEAFADALTGVYATDPNYGTALKKVMRQSGLYQYNRGAEPPAKLAEEKPVSTFQQVTNAAETAAAINANLPVLQTALNLPRSVVTEVMAAAPATAVEHATTATKLKLGEKSTWIGAAIVAASMLADPTVQAAMAPLWTAVKSGQWGGILSAVIGLGLVISRSRSTPRTDAVLAAQRLMGGPVSGPSAD